MKHIAETESLYNKDFKPNTRLKFYLFSYTNERAALTRKDGTFRPSLYKALLFKHVTGALKSGDINLPLSYKYRPMNAYLISPKRWEQ